MVSNSQLGKKLRDNLFLQLIGPLIDLNMFLQILRKFLFLETDLGLLITMMLKFLNYTIHPLEVGVVP